jgi:penicillin-binding protein 2
MTTTKGIECTGFLVLGGKKMPAGRCWVASMYEGIIPSVKHHPIPVEAPHHGVDGNPDGFLEFADALERSCNVYFETVADAFGPERLSAWYYHFGLGRETGIGIAEARGSLPTAMPGRQPSVTWFSGIGQVGVQVTPIQMANVAATIARDGIWMRPKLVEGDVPTSPVKTRDGEKVPDVADLHLDKAALAAAREGMLRVVNSRAGSGSIARMSEFLVAGKTGTAQAPKLRDSIKNPDGSIARDEKGHIKWQLRTPATFEHETDTPWYRGWGEKGEQVDHAWFIGYAPADDPQVAIAVVVQYGGGGGKTAATVGKKALLACVEHGYIKLRK